MKRILSVVILVVVAFTATAKEAGVYTVNVERGGAVVQDSLQPIAKILSKDGKYSLTIGGNINMKASYDFNGSIDSPDFIPSAISVPGSYDSQRRFGMDATTSRVEVKGRVATEQLGDVELCLNMDFRGGTVGSYMPRVRLAYITVADFVVGRNFTVFADLGAAVPNIDFQETNVSPYIYTTQIKYAKSFIDNRLTLGLAVEYEPYESSTLGDTYLYQTQYIPNVPAYLQYNWSESRGNHLRITGLYKSIPLYNTTTESNINLNGWGTQLSGSVGVGSYLKLCYSGTLGEGITNYIQDLYGSGLDAVVSGGVSAEPQMTFMYGWQTSFLAQVSEKTMVSGGYSIVNVEGSKSRFASDDYRRGDYIFMNIFYSLTPRVQLATEYLRGSRTNVDGARGTANRINTMVQYNF